ncbi:chemotaxis protein [Rhodovulum sp. 12E13]|uniref:CheR family methyltransferase n=1 Tax=Rhodovulum sp. 12E13 TaxID=2203891 RepID=UPI000E17A5E0|nr:protein-glutamate O-methyltransferase [Rhodovulum sp. 12E13]RDC74532.1 chemotaxis protein [Rhodovulum sp. 12E13]
MTGAPALSPAPSAGRLDGPDLAHFDTIAARAHREAGLVLPRDKAPMVLARIGKRLRASGHATLAEYCAFLDSEAGVEERRELIYTLTTNVTSFFREQHHFDGLRERILPGLVERARAGGRVRLWSAGCSSGQEPYSLAMVVLDALPEAARCDLRILATDIDPYVLAEARKAVYPEAQVEPVPEAMRRRFLEPAPGRDGTRAWRVAEPARSLVAFRELNLLKEWPMRGRFDAIFCRNVVIYFDRETQRCLWERFAAALAPGGHLFLGHSERIDTAATDAFRVVGTTMYQRAAPGAQNQTRG